MKILKTIFVFLTVLFITSCSGDEETKSPEPTVPLNLLIKESSNMGPEINYVYNANHKIIEINQPFFNTTGSSYKKTITYNADGKIEEVATKDSDGWGTTDSKEKYSYNQDGTLQKKELFELNSNSKTYEFTSSAVYTYNLNQVVAIYNSTNSKSRFVYNYNTAGNLLKTTYYRDVTDANPSGNLDGETDFGDYDDKKYIYSSLPEEYTFPQKFKNNPKIQGNNTYTYEYNTDGYTTKETTSSWTSNYEYQKIE